MKKIFIIHGFNGYPNGGWRPWLMSELRKKDVYACALPMPSPDKPTVDKWVKTISMAVESPNRNIFLVGHSLGVNAILRYLETLPVGDKIGGAILVSGPYENLKDEEHKVLAPFFETPFDFDHIKKTCSKFVIIHSTDDPVVSFNNAILMANKLSCEIVSLSKGGHFNGSSGIYKFPELLETLEKIIV